MLLLVVWAARLAAQQYASPVLDEYLRQGLANNLGLKTRHLEWQKSLESIRQARSFSSPTVQFNANYTRAIGGRSIDLPIGDLLNPVYMALNSPQRVDNQSIQFLPDNFHETKFKIAYPLFNSDLRHNRQIQHHLSDSKEAEKRAYEQQLRYQITIAYLRYLQSVEAEKIWINSRNVLTELRRFNESLVKNNVATRDVVATADYELSKVDKEVYSLRSNQNTARAYFNFLINRDLQADVTLDTALLRRPLPQYALPELITYAQQHRQEFAALQSGIQASESAQRLQEANRVLPDAYIGGEIGFQGFGYTFDKEQAYAIGQIGVTYDLFNGGQNKTKVQQARIETERIRNQYAEAEQQIALQVTQAWNELEAAKYSWQTAQAGLKAAEESFRIVNNKYRANQALLLEFLEAQNRVTTARLQVSLAWTDVLIQEAELRKAAGM
ncbi:MAG: TolC family protein [Saprospiraceae bacterium]|nr:TolC family protein [Saprospiraceae bacterium]